MKKWCLFAIIITILFLDISCKPDHFLITDINFNAVVLEKEGSERLNNRYKETDKFDQRIIFEISYVREFVRTAKLNLISSAHAMKKGKVFDNPLLRDTYSLSFAKPFTYKGQVIAAGTNVFDIASIKNSIIIFETSPGYQILEFTDAFMKDTQFDLGNYAINFGCKTSDDRIFSKTITVQFI